MSLFEVEICNYGSDLGNRGYARSFQTCRSSIFERRADVDIYAIMNHTVERVSDCVTRL